MRLILGSYVNVSNKQLLPCNLPSPLYSHFPSRQDLKVLSSDHLDYEPFHFVDEHRSPESEIVRVQADMTPLVKETMTKFKNERVS